MAQEFTFTVNGVERTTTQNKPLLRYLRDDLHIHSAKDGCSEGACGTCTIHVDGAAVKACVLTTALAAGRNIVTVEGLPEDVREAFVYAFGAVGAVQCGFCIPGMVMAGAALIAEDPEPTEEQIKYAIRGNVCRCTGYKKIIEGISLAAAVLRGEKQIDEDLERGDDYGVGKRAFRIDVRKKVLGEGKYPDDIDEIDQPGLTYASAVRSKYPRARVLSIDTSKAEALPGVVGIPHGVHSVFDESDPENIIDRGGSEQMLSDGLQSNYFPQVDGYNSLLIEIEKYDGEPLVEDFERGPFLAAGIDAEGTAAYMVPGADNGQEA